VGQDYSDEQYKWLKQTLERSNAKFKFVFAHHVLGEGRGGVEMAKTFEWGGYDKRGKWLFNEQRPGWEMPIHQLMVNNGVNIFFQGYDHFFVKQDLDGIVYLECPMPGDITYGACLETGDCYGPGKPNQYKYGDILGNSGHVRVTVSGSNAVVDYVRAYLAKDENDDRKNGEVDYSFKIKAE